MFPLLYPKLNTFDVGVLVGVFVGVLVAVLLFVGVLVGVFVGVFVARPSLILEITID